MMPTEEQMKELTNNCSREWTQLNGVNGVLLTGPNGNSIFLPAVGFYNGTELSYGGERGCYWSNTLDSDFSCDGTALFTTSSDCRTNNVRRFRGLPIRPVRKKLHPSDYVDLGLPSGTLWATCNVGANSPEEFGDYFAWGETEPKSDYSWETYKWCMGSNNTLTKYCPYSDWGYNGFRDGKWNFEPEDDAATANWGEDWETPDYYDFWELFDNITSEFTKVNGVKGLKLTGNNGNSIFLPVAPIRVGTGFSHVNGGYWMNIVGGYAYSRVPYESAILYFDLEIDNYAWDSNSEERCYGLFVRPVRKK